MEWIGVVLGALAAIIAIAFGIGLALPREHLTEHTMLLRHPRPTVFAKLVDYRSRPAWHPNIERVELLRQSDTGPTWRERLSNGEIIDVETLEMDAPRRVVWRFHEERRAFRGRWDLNLDALDSNTRLTIRQCIEAPNPLARFGFRFMRGERSSLRLFAGALERSFG